MANTKVSTMLGKMTEQEAQQKVNQAFKKAVEKTEAAMFDVAPERTTQAALELEIALNSGTQAQVERLHDAYSARCQAALDEYNSQVSLVLSGFLSHFELEDGAYTLSIDRKKIVKQ